MENNNTKVDVDKSILYNPYTVYNGTLSAQRNMFITSSLAIVILGFSNKFKNKNVVNLIKIIGIATFAISIFIGYESAREFSRYLEIINKNPPKNIKINSWKRWLYVNYIYSTLMTIVLILCLKYKIL